MCIILMWLDTYVMWSSKISRKSEILILRYSQTKEVFPFVSFCFGNSLIADIFWTGCSISMGFSAKCSFANACYNPIRNWKLNMTDFRLILLDHTTYLWWNCRSQTPTGLVRAQNVLLYKSQIPLFTAARIWTNFQTRKFSPKFSVFICLPNFGPNLVHPRCRHYIST